jgi:hypothetical protein
MTTVVIVAREFLPQQIIFPLINGDVRSVGQVYR